MKRNNLPNWCRRTSRTPTLNTSTETGIRKTDRSKINTQSHNYKIKILSAKNTSTVSTHAESRLQRKEVQSILDKMSQMKAVRSQKRPERSGTPMVNDQRAFRAARIHVFKPSEQGEVAEKPSCYRNSTTR